MKRTTRRIRKNKSFFVICDRITKTFAFQLICLIVALEIIVSELTTINTITGRSLIVPALFFLYTNVRKPNKKRKTIRNEMKKENKLSA